MLPSKFFLSFSAQITKTPVVLYFFKKNFPLFAKMLIFFNDIVPKNIIKKITISNYDFLLSVAHDNFYFLFLFLKKHMLCKFQTLLEITAIDFPGQVKRFQLNYLLLSVIYNFRIRVILLTSELVSVNSLTLLFPNANWYERELWDLFGISFLGHPDLRRILTDYGFKWHPLRKDFPLSGYIEIFYDETKKAIVYVPVSLAQDFRNFNFKNPWRKKSVF